MTSIGDILRNTILTSVFTSGICTFCESSSRTYTDPETKCLYCLSCLVIAVEAEGRPEEAEALEIVQMGRDYIYQSRSKQSRLAA